MRAATTTKEDIELVLYRFSEPSELATDRRTTGDRAKTRWADAGMITHLNYPKYQIGVHLIRATKPAYLSISKVPYLWQP